MDIYAHDIKWNLLNPALWCLTSCTALAPHGPTRATAGLLPRERSLGMGDRGLRAAGSGGGARGWIWDRTAVHWLSPGRGVGAALFSSFPGSICLAAPAGWDGTWPGVRATFSTGLVARIPHFPLHSPQTSGKIHLQLSLGLCCPESAAGA